MTIIGIDSSALLAYYFARLPGGPVTAARASAGPMPPWDLRNATPLTHTDATARSTTTPFIDTKDRLLIADAGQRTTNAGSQIEAIVNSMLSERSAGTGTATGDNHKLFGLYKALHRLDYIAEMALRDGVLDGQRVGLDQSFQAGLTQILSFIGDATFDNLTLMAGPKTASVQSGIAVPAAYYGYTGRGIVTQSALAQALPGISTSDSFTISITKANVTTQVVIDLSSVAGSLTLDNINRYVNDRMTALGFGTRFGRTQTGGSIKDDTGTWGIRIDSGAGENVALSSSQATPSLYVVGSSGSLGKEQGKLLKLSDLSGTPDSVFSRNIEAESGTSTAKATALDADGNVYVVGYASGSFGSQLNQAPRDAFLTKYDSAGNAQWTRLLGSAEDAAAFAVTVDVNGGIVVTGSVTGTLSPSSIGGSSDTFVAKYDSAGTRKWLRHVAPVASDHATTLITDSAGDVYVGGQLSGTIAAGKTSAGGVDTFITKLSSTGSLLYHRQFGSTGTDTMAGMALGSDGRLIVASVQNGRATLTKFAADDGDSAALWAFDIGDLQGGTLSGLAMSGNDIFVSGTTANAALDAGGNANIARASSGGTEAFVFKLADRTQGNGRQQPRADYISYVGTANSEQAGTLSVSDGKVFLTGTTTGTFAGESRTTTGAHNLFVAQLDAASGALGWARQYGGLEAQSKGAAVVLDPQGASVLDVLGVGRGKLGAFQSSSLETQTTLRVGDYFTMRISDLSGTRTAKITVGIGDTLRTLATRINAHLLQAGKASVAYSADGLRLKIEANPETRIELIGAPKELNALAGLGIPERLLVNEDNNKDGDDSQAAEAGPHIVGLGLTGKLDLLTKARAGHAHSVLLGAMALIKKAYAQLNPQTASPGAPAMISPYMAGQMARYQAAMTMLGG